MKFSWLSSGIKQNLQCVYAQRAAVRSPALAQRCQAHSRELTTSSRLYAFAAAEIQFDDSRIGSPIPTDENGKSKIYARVVPISPSYFTSQPNFTDHFLHLNKLVSKYGRLPTLPPGDAPRVAWYRISHYRSMVGEQVKSSRYHRVLDLIQRLNQIHPSLMPEEVKDALNAFKRTVDPFLNKAKPTPIDKFGRALATGRRKSSTARAWVVEGDGQVLINGKNLAGAFDRVHDRESAIWALKATDRIDKYNVWALVEGGGTTGQAEALTLAVGKALLAHEPALKPVLRRAGCITRDPRKVERKKPGHLKARKMPAWVKR